MAPQAERTIGIAREELYDVRVADGRTMAALTLNLAMWRAPERPHVFTVTLGAGVIALVFYRKVLPFLLVAQAIVVIGKRSAVDAEVVRNNKNSRDEDEYDNPDRDPQRV
jgi:hypothetical protein